MTSRRIQKAAQAVLEQVSSTILFSLKDPRVKNVTVTHVEVSPDLRTAKVSVSIMGDEKAQALCLHGLNSARGFLQAKVADRLQTRYTPVLKFVVDPGVKRSIETSRIIRDALAEGQSDSDDGSGLSDNAEAAADGGDAISAPQAASAADGRAGAAEEGPHDFLQGTDATRGDPSGTEAT